MRSSGGAVLLEEPCVGRAAAQGFDTDGARACVGVEEGRALDAGLQDVEEGLAQAVGRGTRSGAGEALQPARSELSRDNPHQPTVTRP